MKTKSVYKLIFLILPFLLLLAACNKEEEGPDNKEGITVNFRSLEENVTMRGEVTINIDASDKEGISKVEFFIDDVLQKEMTSPPYQVNFNTKDYDDGEHVLKAVAYNIKNNKKEAKLIVNTGNYLFTINAGPKLIYSTEYESLKRWIFFSDNDGKVIAVKELGYEEIIKIPFPENFSKDSIFANFVFIQNNEKYLTTHSYNNVGIDTYYCKVSETFYLNKSSSESQSIIGQTEMIIENSPFSKVFSLGMEGGNGYSVSFSNNQWNLSPNLTKSPTNGLFIIFSDYEEAPNYKWFENIEVGKSYIYDFSSLSVMTDYVEYRIPGASSLTSILRGAKSSENPLFVDLGIISTYESNIIKRYIPDGLFTTYDNYFHFTDDEGTYTFHKKGPLVTNFQKPEFKLTLINSALNNFSLTTTGEYDVTEIVLSYEDYNFNNGYINIARWNLLAPNSNSIAFKFPTIPIEITKNIPFDLRENILLNRIILKDYIDINSYSQYIKYLFHTNSGVHYNGMETFSKSFQSENRRMKNSIEYNELKENVNRIMFKENF